MRLYELYAELETLAPRALSAPWDNDGVMCAPLGDINVTHATVSLDATLEAIDKAASKSQLLVTHHPMIFKGIKSLTAENAPSARTLRAVTRGLSVISLHTRLDAADGGVNDALAQRLGLHVSGSFGDCETPTLGRLCELDGITVDELAERTKRALGCESVRVYGSGRLRRAALVGGDGKSFVECAIAAGADVLITGDAGYNVCEAAAERGFAVIETGHYHTEQPVCDVLAEHLRRLGIECDVLESCPSRMI